MVLLAICDARYCFSHIDVGEYGSNNDSGILKNSRMGRKFENNAFNIPKAEALPESNLEMPYFLVGTKNSHSKIGL